MALRLARQCRGGPGPALGGPGQAGPGAATVWMARPGLVPDRRRQSVTVTVHRPSISDNDSGSGLAGSDSVSDPACRHGHGHGCRHCLGRLEKRGFRGNSDGLNLICHGGLTPIPLCLLPSHESCRCQGPGAAPARSLQPLSPERLSLRLFYISSSISLGFNSVGFRQNASELDSKFVFAYVHFARVARTEFAASEFSSRYAGPRPAGRCTDH